jgi:hypothetical protein
VWVVPSEKGTHSLVDANPEILLLGPCLQPSELAVTSNHDDNWIMRADQTADVDNAVDLHDQISSSLHRILFHTCYQKQTEFDAMGVLTSKPHINNWAHNPID